MAANIRKIKSSVESIVDIARLKASNDLLHKWTIYLQVPLCKYSRFLADIRKNKDSYAAKICESRRQEFLNDYEVMFYAAEVENDVIIQFYPMIINIIRKLNETNQDAFEELISIGLTSIRISTWKYRTHESNASLFTFIYDGAFNRLRGTRFKIMVQRCKKMSGVHEIHESDYFSRAKDNKSMSALIDKKTKSANDKYIDELNLEKAFEEANLTPEEKTLMQAYIERDYIDKSWAKEYANNNLLKNGNAPTRQAIDNRLVVAKYKLWKVLHKRFNMNLKDETMPFVKRYSKVKKYSI